MVRDKKDPDELINVDIRVTRRSAEWLAHFLNEYLDDLPQGAVPEGHEIISALWPVVMTDDVVEDNPYRATHSYDLLDNSSQRAHS